MCGNPGDAIHPVGRVPNLPGNTVTECKEPMAGLRPALISSRARPKLD